MDKNPRAFYNEWMEVGDNDNYQEERVEQPFVHPVEIIPLTTLLASASDAVKDMLKPNNKAYNQVLTSSSEIPLGIVRCTKGKVSLAIEWVNKKFAEHDESNLTELLQAFTSYKLKSMELDPDVLVSENQINQYKT